LIIRSVVVGLGKIGMDYDFNDSSINFIATHVKALTLHPNFELVGVVDQNFERRSRFNKKYNISSYNEIEELPKKSKVDFVIIATNTKDHYDSFIKIIENIKPHLILCEKPMSQSIHKSRKMIDIARNSDTIIAVNYIRQYDQGFRALISRIKDGEIGFPLKSCVWYRKGIYNNASHMINLLGTFLGEVIDVNIISHGRLFDGWDPEPDLKIQFDKGEVIFLAGNEEDFSHGQMEIYGPDGKILLDNDGNLFLWKKEKSSSFDGYIGLESKPESIQTDIKRYQYNVLDNISDAFIKNSKIYCDGKLGLETMEILNLITEKLNGK